MNINHSSTIIKPSPLTPIGTAKPRDISQVVFAHTGISDASREKLTSYVDYQQKPFYKPHKMPMPNNKSPKHL